MYVTILPSFSEKSKGENVNNYSKSKQPKPARTKGFPVEAQSAVVNDSPVGCQSRRPDRPQATEGLKIIHYSLFIIHYSFLKR